MHCCVSFTANPSSCVFVVQSLSHVRPFAVPWTLAWLPGFCASSCPLSWLCYIIISSSAALLSFYLQSSPASVSFPVSWLLASGGQSIGASASASGLPMNIQGWFPLGLTGLISLQSKGLSRVFSSTTVWKNWFFGAQPSLWSSSHVHTWLLEKPQLC